MTESGDSLSGHKLIITNNFHKDVGNVANHSESGASQHYNPSRGAEAVKGLAAPIQAIGELMMILAGPACGELGEFARDEISVGVLQAYV